MTARMLEVTGLEDGGVIADAENDVRSGTDLLEPRLDSC